MLEMTDRQRRILARLVAEYIEMGRKDGVKVTVESIEPVSGGVS